MTLQQETDTVDQVFMCACVSAVRGIFEKYGCLLDVRDISMSSEFREELKERMGGTAAPVPRVFVGEKYLGGFDEVLHLNETEQLKKMLEVKGMYFVHCLPFTM